MPTTPNRTWQVGDQIHGFANGYFGRDSYGCRIVEHVGPDYLVTRNARGQTEKISITDANDIHDPNSRAHCEDLWEDGTEDEPCTVADDVAAWHRDHPATTT